MRAWLSLSLLSLLAFTSQSLWAQSTTFTDQPVYTSENQAKIVVPTVQYNHASQPGTLETPVASNSIGNPGQYFSQAACNDTCCQSGQCQRCCEKQGGFYAGFAAVIAKPHFKESFEFSQTNTATGQQSLVPFQYDYEFTPRVWVGYDFGNGTGIRGTFWQFDEPGATTQSVADGTNIYGAHAVSIIFPANIFAAFPGDTLETQSSLNTQIYNLYLTLDGSLGGVAATAGFGLRWGKLTQSIFSTVSQPPGPPSAFLEWEREFTGSGPSVFLEAKKRVACSRFSAVLSGGGALLFGEKTLERTVIGDQSPQPASPFLSLQDADEVVGIGELGFGLEWAAQLQNGRSLLVRGTYEGQLWAEAGAPTLGFLGFEGFGIAVELAR